MFDRTNPKSLTNRFTPRQGAILEALFVTLLWSSSVVLVKWSVAQIPPLLFAGLRYSLAFLILLPFGLRSGALKDLRTAGRRTWLGLIALGLVFYTLTMGTQFLSLAYLPAMTLNFILSLTPMIVALIAIPLLGEWPTRGQWAGVMIVMLGVLLFFFPISMACLHALGTGIAFLSLLANSFASILGRGVNRSAGLSPLAVTIVSMGVGALVLMIAGLATEEFPALTWRNWAVVIWLATVNTALVFPMWNHSLRILAAVESSVIQTSMAVQVPLLAWLFLDESMNLREIVGLAIAVIGITVVQLSRRSRDKGAS